MPDTTNNIGIKVTTEGVENAVTGLESLVNVLDKLNNSTDTIAKVSTEIQHFSTNVSSLGNVLKKGLNIAGLIAATKTIGKFVDLAVSYVEDINLFTVSMGQFTDRAYDYAQTVQEVMGIDAGEWMRNESVFMSLATGFGIASDRAYLMSEQLTQLSYDLASLYNLDVEEAFLKLKSGFAGELEPLRAIGVDLSKANIMLAAHELGITKTYNAMTQAEKAQLRYYIIMNQTTSAQGDMARTLSAPANQLRIFQSQLQLTARAIGSIFIPMLNAILPVAIAVVRVIRMVVAAIASLFGYTLPEMNWEPLKDTTAAVADDLDDANGSAKKLKKQLAGFDEINNLTTPDPSGGGSAVGGGGWADFELPTYDFLGEAIQANIENFTNKLKELLPILAAIGAVVIVWQGWFALLNGIPKIIGFVEGLWKSIQSLWTLIMANPIVALIALIAGLIAYFVVLYKTNDEFREKVNNAWEQIKAKAQEVIANINTKWEAFKTKFTSIVENVKTAWNNAITAIKTWWTNMVDNIATKWNNFKSTVVQKVEDIKTSIKEKVNNIIGFFEGLANGAISAYNKIVNTMNKFSFSIPSWVPSIGGKSFGLNLKTAAEVSIKRLATGGIITEPTQALIGEAGKEAVLPLENHTEWMDIIAGKIAVKNNNSNDRSVEVLEAILDAVNNLELQPVISDDTIGEANNRWQRNRTRILGV